MPRIFDNIDNHLLPALKDTLNVSYRADFCVGYFNLRGWQAIDQQINHWTGGEDARCRVLVGMFRRPQDELQRYFSITENPDRITNQRALQLRQELARDFHQQLTIGIPTNRDEAALQRLAQQLRDGKVVVKLYLRHPLHAKLYLLYRSDIITPKVGYMGSSNLTFSGLSGNGELNIDVVDQDACTKLQTWFEERWQDRFAIDISQELIEIIEASWASEKPIKPYYIYLKMAYHLSQEAQKGINEFRIPARFEDELLDFQKTAVQIAARYLNQRGGVLLGDVVGLGKTIMATAIARIFQEDMGASTLIICPKNLVKMWQHYRTEYELTGDVLSVSQVQQKLPNLRRYRMVIIDESHNLRNREGRRYTAIRDYIERNDSRCILLSATPYNKTYLDLSNQLRLFLDPDADLGIRPEALLREMGEIEFSRLDVPARSLRAFERSTHPDDWRELMSLYMVRRTRSFIRETYGDTDPVSGRKYLSFADGRREFFPDRLPRRVDFTIDESDPADQYARLYAVDVVDTINDLHLPRYGLGNYLRAKPANFPSPQEQKIIEDLSRGGRRLMGFCRTNLFKRLESSGYAFLLSIERHIVRNYIYLYALENNLPLPIGTQDAEVLDTQFEDEDPDAGIRSLFDADDEDDTPAAPSADAVDAFSAHAAEIYQRYRRDYAGRFRWLRADLFRPLLAKHLREDAENLQLILQECGEWNADRDTQLNALIQLVTSRHAGEKILVFSQFADTVRYLARQLQDRGITAVAAVTGAAVDPTALAWRFSPVSNNQRANVRPEDELRVLIATDVLSEGQNLQDCAVVVNYDLPWAIIRLIQRAGRVDRIGQRSPTIYCYTFWPAEGLERLIQLRTRLRQRLHENQEVVGADEAFFEDDGAAQLLDLYHENAQVLEEDEGEIDLVSYAYQIWKSATEANPDLRRIVPKLPPVSHATKALGQLQGPPGALLYIKTAQGTSALAWMDDAGRSVTYSQRTILDAAACAIDEPALPRRESHYETVRLGVQHIHQDAGAVVGGQLGRPSGARFRTYERLSAYLNDLRGTLLEELTINQLAKDALDHIYRYPLRQTATDILNRQLRSGIRDEDLAELVAALHEENKLCVVQEDDNQGEPRIICSMGLAPNQGYSVLHDS